MNKDIFDNNACPFTVPEGYFDTLQKRIMCRIESEKNVEVRMNISQSVPFAHHSSLITHHFRKWIAAAACILLIFTGVTLYMTHTGKQSAVAETAIDEDFYRWFYASDGATLLAESLDIQIPEYFTMNETGYSDEDEAIIRFLERDNINVAAIVHSMNNESYNTYFSP